ncbi:MAG: LacI family DNA-binding transcriptional regulator [Lentisphaeria bacterium]|nr:LacI family DNA-binding transcriptional regulator [Lentisphaeria bacterium]
MITMKEIGRLAGVSQTAVSFILNGKAEKLSLSDETIRLVQEIALKHNYRPNLLARGMKTGKTGMIGILLRKDGLRQVADGENFNNILMRLYARLILQEKLVIMEGISRDDIQKRKLPNCAANGLLDILVISDSLLLDDPESRQYLQKLLTCVPKCVGSMCRFDETHKQIPLVHGNFFRAGELIAETVWDMGKRSFAILGTDNMECNLSAQQNGFCSRISELSGAPAHIPIFHTHDCWQKECGAEAVAAMLDKGDPLPDVLLCSNDYFVDGAVAELKRSGGDEKKITIAAIGNSRRAINCENQPDVYVGFDDDEYLQKLLAFIHQYENGEKISEPVCLLEPVCYKK